MVKQVLTSTILSNPMRWPWERSMCFFTANRLLPSIMKATWRGTGPACRTLQHSLHILFFIPSLASTKREVISADTPQVGDNPISLMQCNPSTFLLTTQRQAEHRPERHHSPSRKWILGCRSERNTPKPLDNDPDARKVRPRRQDIQWRIQIVNHGHVNRQYAIL